MLLCVLAFLFQTKSTRCAALLSDYVEKCRILEDQRAAKLSEIAFTEDSVKSVEAELSALNQFNTVQVGGAPSAMPLQNSFEFIVWWAFRRKTEKLM